MIFRRSLSGAVHAYADLTNVSLCGYAPLRSPNYTKVCGPATCAHCVRAIEKKARAA
jgi:hypothetical protein